MKRILLTALFGLVISFVSGCGGKPAEVDPSVIADLQAAYNGECNAAAKYAMYAEEAAKAGYQSVASMLKATSKSESIHAEHHKRVLESLGQKAESEIKLPEFTTVSAALEDGIKGETYEVSTMYPDFIKNAKAKNAPAEVIETFSFAMEAEKEHAGFYTETLKNIEEWKAPGKKTFYVCTVCGYTTDKLPASCKVCAAPGEKFEEFK